jgi:hypothetical protein
VRWREEPRHQEPWNTYVQATLVRNQALAFPLLQRLLMRYAPDGRQRNIQPHSAACPTRPRVPWQDFLTIAMVLQEGAAFTENPLMQVVAERSVQSSWQQSFRR